MNKNRTLSRFRFHFPFLRDIPFKIYQNLDPAEWSFPDARVEKIRTKLESKIDGYVMTYDRETFLTSIPLVSHLCAWLQPAILNEAESALLSGAEEKVQDASVSFVVYKKPISIQKPEQSALAHYYTAPPTIF